MNRVLLSAAGGLAMLYVAPANAQSPAAAGAGAEVDAVVVTARKRAEDIQDVPMSVTAISGAAIERAGISSMSELARSVPSLNVIQSNNNRNSTVQIRGIGSSGTNPGIESSVGIFLDGVYMPSAGAIQGNLLDLASVQVLRGPQGTLYGRNTPVGAVVLTSRDPEQTREGMISGGLGSYNERRLGGYVGGGLSDTLAARVSFWMADRDGYEDNLYTGQKINDTKQAGLRGRMKWTPSESFTGNFIGYITRIESHCCVPDDRNPTLPGGVATAGYIAGTVAAGRPYQNFVDGDHKVEEDGAIFDKTTIGGVSFQGDWDLANGLTLTSITAYNDFNDKIPFLSSDNSSLDTGRSEQQLRRKTYSEELRIASPSRRVLDYVAGLYLYQERLDYTAEQTVGTQANRLFPGNLRVAPGDHYRFFYDQTTKSAAVFGQATWNVTDVFRVTGGLRWSYDDKKAALGQTNDVTNTAIFRAQFPDSNIPNLKRQEDKFTYTVNAQYDFNDNVMLYATYATGFKSGGFNARSSPAGTPLEFNAENTDTVEVGIKSTFLDRRVIFNANVYRMNLKGFQESILNPLTGTGFLVGNAGDRRVDGVEFEATVRPVRPLSITASGAYTDAKFTDYTAGQCSFGKVSNGSKPGTCNFNGLTPGYNPKYKGAISAEWRQEIPDTPMDWFLGGDATYTGAQFLDATLDVRGRQSAYRVYGLRAGVEARSGAWRLTAFAKNLSDESYYVAAAPRGLTNLVSGGGTTAASGFVSWYGPPRTYGIEARVQF